MFLQRFTSHIDRIITLGFHHGCHLLDELIDFLGRERALFKKLTEEFNGRHKVVGRRGVSHYVALNLEFGTGVGNGLTIHPFGTAREHRQNHRIKCRLTAIAFKITPLEIRENGHGAAARFLGQQRHFNAADAQTFCTSVNVVLTRVKGFGLISLFLESCLGDYVFDVGRGHIRRTLGMIIRNKETDHAVVSNKIGSRSRVDGIRRHLGSRVAIGKKQTPVTQSDIVREIHGKAFRIRKRTIVIHSSFRKTRADFFVGSRLLGKRKLDGFDELVLHGLNVVTLLNHRAKHHEARITRGHGPAENLRGHTGFHKRLIKTSARRVGQNVSGSFHRIGVFGQSRGHAVSHCDKLRFAGSADFEGTRTVGDGLNRPSLGQYALRTLDLAERFLNPFKHLGFVELARDGQHGVVGLIPLAVKGLQIFDRHVFNVATCTDCAAPVSVPIIEHRLHAFEHHGNRLVFPHFILVTHNGHFGIKILLGNEGIGHRVGTPAQRPLHIVVACGKAHEVIRAIKPRCAVHAKAAACELLGGIRVVLAALEHQMFKQMRHTCFAVVFHTAAHEISRVDRSRGFALVCKKNNLQTIVEFIAFDAFDRVHGL